MSTYSSLRILTMTILSRGLSELVNDATFFKKDFIQSCWLNAYSKIKQPQQQNGLIGVKEGILLRDVLSQKLDIDLPFVTTQTTPLDLCNVKILLLADSHPSVIVASLRALYYSETQKLTVDYMKVSHHGSRYNTSPELLSLINCRNLFLQPMDIYTCVLTKLMLFVTIGLCLSFFSNYPFILLTLNLKYNG